MLATVLTFFSPQASLAFDPQTDINLGTAAAYSSISSGALTVGAGGNVAGSAVVGEGSASTSGVGATVGAAVAGIPQAQADLATAYAEAMSRPATGLIDGSIDGRTFVPGTYRAEAAIANAGVVTLDALGNPDAIFIFQIEAAFSSAASSAIVLVNGAQARHVYWQVLGAVTIGASATFAGTILGNAAITVGADTVIAGRTLTMGGAVSLGAGMGTLGVPEITLTNTPSPIDLVFDGETITFTFVVTNSGNVALSIPSIMVSGIPGVSDISYAWLANPDVLLPKESVTATATYVATFADAVRRSVTATAVVAGTSSTNVIVLASQTKTVVVWPIPVVDTVTVTQGVATTFDVLTNDQTLPTGVVFSRTQLTSHPRAIGDATSAVPVAPIFASVTCSSAGETRGFCTYQSSELFTGMDGFDYSVSQRGRSWNVHVNIAVVAHHVAPTSRADRVVATLGGTAVEVLPLANDTDDSPGTLVMTASSVIHAGQGTLTCSTFGCTYVPPTAGFTGTVLASYSAATQALDGTVGPSATSTITIFVDAAPLVKHGFTSSASTDPIISAGEWTQTATVANPVSSCVEGRPQSFITWTASSRATSWLIERRLAAAVLGATDGAWVPIATVDGGETSFVDHRVGESQSYEWRVRPDLFRWSGVASDASSQSLVPASTSAVGC